MDLLDRLLLHDSWTTRKLLLTCRQLDDADLDREFDLALRTVRATLSHIVRNVEAWTDLMHERDVRAVPDGGETVDGLLSRLDAAAADLAALARDVRERGAWDETWVDRLDDPPREKTFGGAIGHVITHSMHHRGQAIHMLRRLGARDVPEGDVLGWERRTQGGSRSEL
jgi:uncharacterized damage-inducible protein DinB